MTPTVKELIEAKAVELYKSGLTDSEDFFTNFEGLDEEEKARWYRVANNVLKGETKARIDELNEYGKFDRETPERIINLQAQLKEFENG